ncbi:YceI family protein [Nakamurella lactea]|uniref:YceI family protein n=1 Tax=Nakamurella lactea TaxID=459515 RepID=UPI0003F9E61C|nr:YceI family protein [Nakamurella lactea]
MTTSTTALAAGTWNADPTHTDVSFKARHMGVGKVRGNFELTSGTLTVGANGIEDSTVTAVIDVASVETKSEQRNDHVKSADFLDAEKFPTIDFVSTGIRDFDGENFTLIGDLTVHGVTKSVELAAEFNGALTDAYGLERSGFSAEVTISRKEFGVDIQMGFGAGNAVVSDKIEIAIDIEFVLASGE